MSEHPEDERARRARVIRTAVLLALFAIAVYGMFILTMAQRSQGM
ncbi:hypothetical protein [Thioalkalivibrio sp. XN8]|nr:hypothetical protein [Thioalkalivibrio sp. XN8]